MTSTVRLARAELRKLFTTKALPVSFAIAIVLAIGSVIIDAMVAGQGHNAPLGTNAAVYHDHTARSGLMQAARWVSAGTDPAGRSAS